VPLAYWGTEMAMAQGQGWRALAIDDVEPLPWRHSQLRWLALRGALGTRIAGIGGYVARLAGQEVVEDHTETSDGRGHEELYLVLRGRAEFMLDGIALDVRAGSFLLIDDPAVRRSAVAAEPDTLVIAFGGPPSFEPAASEWIERARAHAVTDPARAAAVLEDLRVVYAGSPAVLVGEAVVAAATGERVTAVAALRELLELRPELRGRLVDDPDLGPLLPDAV
jgi:hypothetical protein